jgi:hypothetical protein
VSTLVGVVVISGARTSSSGTGCASIAVISFSENERVRPRDRRSPGTSTRPSELGSGVLTVFPNLELTLPLTPRAVLGIDLSLVALLVSLMSALMSENSALLKVSPVRFVPRDLDISFMNVTDHLAVGSAETFFFSPNDMV